MNQLSFFLSFPFFSFLFSFLSFPFLLALFSPFYSRKYALFFDPSYRARQEPFYSACRNQGFTICPLTAFVWPGHTCRPPEVCATHSCQTEAGFSSPPYRSTSFPSRYKCSLSPLSRHAPNGSPSNLPLLGGLSSQQDVPPKRAWAGAANRSFPLSPPPNHTPFTSYLWPMAPPCPILAGYRLVVPGPCACFPFRYVQ